MQKNDKIYIAGHRGLVGSALLRELTSLGYANLVVRTHQELDLCDQLGVRRFFESEKPDYVFLAAARVGGILANCTRPAEFLYDNLMMATNIIHSAYQTGVKKLLFLGSSCIYPKLAPQPLQEESLLTGPLEPTNEAYALAKIAGVKLCEAYNRQYGTQFISVMPTNLYGPHDNFDLASSHVLPALLRKFHEGKVSGATEVVVWGTGTPVREFLHVEDAAAACVYLMNRYDGNERINIGTGIGITIQELAQRIKKVTGFTGQIVFDATKPDGTPVKINDITRLKQLGWLPKISLEAGLETTYQWYKNFVLL